MSNRDARRSLQSIVIAASLVPCALASAAPTVPPALAVPAGHVLRVKANANGTQNYICRAAAAGFAWALEGPEAQLRDEHGQIVAKHYAGPTWEWTDGSSAVAEPQAKVDAPDARGIPWLLLVVKRHAGAGILAQVSFVQRLETDGGRAPADGCDAAHRDARVKVPYRATYYFWQPK
jgi:hypothetical protein